MFFQLLGKKAAEAWLGFEGLPPKINKGRSLAKAFSISLGVSAMGSAAPVIMSI